MTKCVTSPPLLACTVDGHTLLWKIENKKSAPFLNVLFYVKHLPVTHVRQATIFGGQTVKFYRPVTGDRHLFRGLFITIPTLRHIKTLAWQRRRF
jgi:hypothetical protein